MYRNIKHRKSKWNRQIRTIKTVTRIDGVEMSESKNKGPVIGQSKNRLANPVMIRFFLKKNDFLLL